MTAKSNPKRAPSRSISPREHILGLDVLRGIAIVMVLAYHALASLANQPNLTPPQTTFFRLFETAAMGVQLFFVLSGFLITGILLDSRKRINFYRPFYLRRARRILPAYLLMIALLRLTGVISWRFTAASLLFLGNMPSILQAVPEYGVFWSLSVEEQFYLLWPVLVRKLSIRRLAILCTTIILGSPILRLALLHAPPTLADIHFKTWVVADFFAAGALLAIAIRSTTFTPRLNQTATAAIVAGLVFIALAAVLPHFTANLQQALDPTPWVLFFSGTVLWACLHPGLASTLPARPLIFLGRISYGLYLVHPWIFQRLERLWPLQPTALTSWPLVTAMLLRAAIESSLAIGVAWLSRITIEEYFLRRKPDQPHQTP